MTATSTAPTTSVYNLADLAEMAGSPDKSTPAELEALRDELIARGLLDWTSDRDGGALTASDDDFYAAVSAVLVAVGDSDTPDGDTTVTHPAHADCGSCHRSETHDGLERVSAEHWEPAGTITRWAAEDAAVELRAREDAEGLALLESMGAPT